MSIVSCPNCGHPNVDTAKFCAKCGNKLTPAETLVMGMGDPSVPTSPPAPSAPPLREVMPPLSAKEQAGFGAPPSPPPSYTPPAYSSGARPAIAPVAPLPPVSAAPGDSGHRFVAMRTIAGLCNILAWVSAVLAFLGGVVFGAQVIGGLLGGGFVGILLGIIPGIIAGALGWIYWRLLGEGIWLALDIEANTRRTATALENQRRL